MECGFWGGLSVTQILQSVFCDCRRPKGSDSNTIDKEVDTTRNNHAVGLLETYSTEGYVHETVNHSIEFISDAGVHTNNRESLECGEEIAASLRHT